MIKEASAFIFAKRKLLEYFTLIKKLLTHIFIDLIVINLILIGLLVFFLITLNASDAGNYIAEILGMIITINVIDFLNKQRVMKQEKNKYDIQMVEIDILSDDIQRIIKEFLSIDNNLNDYTNAQQVASICNKDGFWECEISIKWRLGFLRGKRSHIYKYIIKYIDKEIKKIFIRFNNYIDGELFLILSTMEIMTEEDTFGEVYETSKDYKMHAASEILSLIREVIKLREYFNKYKF